MTEGLTWIDPRELREADENPRTIRDDRYEALMYALGKDPEMLEARPIVIDAEHGDIVMGNMRQRALCELMAAEDLAANEDTEALARFLSEHEGRVPVFVKRFDGEAQRREWMLRDNQAYGEWVPDELAALVAQHRSEGADMGLIGFSDAEAEALLGLARDDGPERGEPNGDPDAAPPAPAQAITKPGDVWQLGDHRLICGDAEDQGVYYALFDGLGIEVSPDAAVTVERARCVWTDPPYNVGYDPEKRESYFSPERKAQPLGTIEGDARQDGASYARWLTECFKIAGAYLEPGGAAYVCHADKMVRWVSQAFEDAGWYLSSQLLWLKTVLVFGRSDYHYKHEPLLYGWKSGAAHQWFGDRTQTTVFEVASDHYNEGRGEGYVHPTQKPYDLIRPMLENSTEPGDIVLDPFAGSGSTLIACQQLGRRCRAIELAPGYCDVIVSRWSHYAGERAELVVSGDGNDPSTRDLEPVWSLSTA